MAKAYKLNQNIKQFIIEQKKLNSKLSCRELIPLIRRNFQVSLSKSLINKVIKQNRLSSLVGRRRQKEPVISQQPLAIQVVRNEGAFIKNGGCMFLKAADLKLGLTNYLAENLSAYFADLSEQDVQALIEALIFMPLFKDNQDLWWFTGKEISSKCIEQYLAQLSQVFLPRLNMALTKLGFNHNLNDINELHRICLLQLSSFVQSDFFPSAYQSLDLSAMQECFYCLWARLNKSEECLEIQLFYPEGFAWKDDIIWQEDLIFAVNSVNEANIFTQKKEQVLISPQPKILPQL